MQRADVGGTAFGITPARQMLLDWATFPTWEESSRMMAPRPGEEKRVFAFLGPFDEKVKIFEINDYNAAKLFLIRRRKFLAYRYGYYSWQVFS